MVTCTCQWRIQDFPEEGAPTPQGGAPTYEIAKFSEKLHEIERIWTPGGGARPSRPPLRSANACRCPSWAVTKRKLQLVQFPGLKVSNRLHFFGGN